MNKRLVMWGTLLAVFLISVVGSYKFINRNNQDSTIELSAPTLPLVTTVIESKEYNMLYGHTNDMNVSDAAKYICPVGEKREIQFKIQTLGTQVQKVGYEVRNNDGTRLIESGTLSWTENRAGCLDVSVKLKDLIVAGEEYFLTLILDAGSFEDVCYYTRFVYNNTYDLNNQLQFVMDFHNNTFDKEKVTEIAKYMETDRNQDNSSLGYVNIHARASQVVWDKLPVERITEPEVYITYLQDNLGAYTLDYYVSSTVDGREQYYHVLENFLVSSYGEKLYLLDYERTADTIFLYEEDVYQNDKIDLSIQSGDIAVAESEDGNMATFVVNGTLYYYDDNENKINYVYGFFDALNSDPRSMYFGHNIKVLQVDESGSIYFILYGYINRGNHEGKTGIVLFNYNGRTKLVEEIGFYESSHSAEYVMQEVEELAFLSRQEILYLCVDGNIVAYNMSANSAKTVIAHEENQQLYISADQSCVVVKNGENVEFWHLETGLVREITNIDGKIIPQGFIYNDFVYGISKEEDMVLQSDGSYAQYMREICIQDAEGKVLKQYAQENILIAKSTISDNQIILDRVILQGGKVLAATQDHIVASKKDNDDYNGIVKAMTSTYQTIMQVNLKNKIHVDSLQSVKAKEVFYEGIRSIDIEVEGGRVYCSVHNPWRVTEYVTDLGLGMSMAAKQKGYALDQNGIVVWQKAATVSKNQIMSIELENATPERSSKNICLDIMLRQIGSPQDTLEQMKQGKTCQQILSGAGEDYVLLDITGSDLESMLYYTNQDIPIMVLFNDGEALLITGFNQFNIVVMDPVNHKLGYMSRSDASELLAETENQVFTYYHKQAN